MEITFKLENITHHGIITTIKKNNEFLHFVDLGEKLQFTIHLSDDGNWESDNPDIDKQIIMHVGNAIENMEDLSDVLSELDSLRK